MSATAINCHYQYDAASNRISAVDAIPGTTAARLSQASYNNVNELTELDTNTIPLCGTKVNDFLNPALASRDSHPTAIRSDANGNLIFDGKNYYAWDAENRLVKITYPGDGNNSQFSYDALGRCTQIVEVTGGTTTSTRQFVWCGNERCEERDASGNVTKRFFHRGEQIGSKNYFFVKDHLGSIRALTDMSGNLVAQYAYSPFGEQTTLRQSVASDFGFAGMYVHQRSGLNLTMFRAYSPTLGRWLSRDPMGENAGTNLYGYVANNPVSGRDPLGLSPSDVSNIQGTMVQQIVNSVANGESLGFGPATNIAKSLTGPLGSNLKECASQADQLTNTLNQMQQSNQFQDNWTFSTQSVSVGQFGGTDVVIHQYTFGTSSAGEWVIVDPWTPYTSSTYDIPSSSPTLP